MNNRLLKRALPAVLTVFIILLLSAVSTLQVKAADIEEPDYFSEEYEMIHFPAEPLGTAVSEEMSAVDVAAERIAAAIRKAEDTVDIADLELSSEELTEIRDRLERMAINDVVWYYGVYSQFIRINYLYDNADGTTNVEKIQSMVSALETAVDKALSTVNDEMSDFEKILTLYNYVLKICDYNYVDYYDDLSGGTNQQLYGVLVEGKAVCGGYANALSFLLQQVGIESYYVSSSPMNHAWNLVKLGDCWYHIDATWDDSSASYGNDYVDEGEFGHTYFLCSDYEYTTGLPQYGLGRHYGWSEELPEATDSFTLSGKAVNGVYYDAYWYWQTSNGIAKSKIDKNGAELVLENANIYSEVWLSGDRLYYECLGAGGVKDGIRIINSYDLLTGEEKTCIDITDTYPDYRITEFAVKNDQLVLVLGHTEERRYRRITINTDELDMDTVWADSLLLYTVGDAENVFVSGEACTDVRYESADTSVATVDSMGLVTATGGGTTTVTVTDSTGNILGECIVIIDLDYTMFADITSEKEIFIELGEERSLEVINKNINHCKYGSVVFESSDTSVVTVDENGKLTSVGYGTAVITASVAASGWKDTCTVIVTELVEVTGVALKDEKITLEVEGETAKLEAVIAPADATYTDVTWESSDTSVATVSADGTVTAVNNGTATITVTTADGGFADTCEVTVAFKVTQISLGSDNYVIGGTGVSSNRMINVTVLPYNAVDTSFVWESSDTSIATVDSEGVVTGVAPGEAYITVSTEDGSVSATCKVTVVTLVISKSVVIFDTQGATEQLTVKVLPESFTDYGEVNWTLYSVDTGAMTLDDNGLLTATGTYGEGNLHASISGYGWNVYAHCTAYIKLKVTEMSIDKSELSFTDIYPSIGGERLNASVRPTDAVAKTVIWTSSDESVAKVTGYDTYCYVYPVSNGAAVITATTVDGGYTDTCNVTVNVPVRSMSISHNVLKFSEIGKTEQLEAYIYPDYAADKTVIWSSSDESVAMVDENGLVTAKANGTTSIKAKTKDGGYTATCVVTVNVPVQSVTLNKDKLVFDDLETSEQLTATINPAGAYYKNITWRSSDPTVATVGSDGMVMATGNGSAWIECYVDGYCRAMCKVEACIKATEISLDIEELKFFYSNEQAQLTATVGPDEAYDKQVIWSSSNEAVATVDGGGYVTAVGNGTATIKATTADGKVSAECKVTVAIAVNFVNIMQDNITLQSVGATEQLRAEVLPADAVNKKVKWISSDSEVATVDENGLVTAVGDGTAMITVITEDGDYRDYCQITVELPEDDFVYVTGVTLDKDNLTITKYEDDMLLKATITPLNADDKRVEWTSSDESVAIVDPDGQVILVSDGTAVITATTVDGGFSASCQLTIKITEYAGVDYAGVFDYTYYSEKYPELIGNIGPDGAVKYFVEYGMAEGHQASEEFSLLAYKSNYPDLGVAFGSDNTRYYMHYINNGKAEGRNATVILVESDTKYYGVEYAEVYNYDYYINNNPDLKAAFGDNKAAALIHFANMGMKEGRQACENFGPKIYRFNYPELQESFGDDMVLYYHHYMDYGKAEGRNGATRDFSAYCEYEGVNYTPVYNYEDYIERNPDVFDAYGLDANAVLKHFVTVGMAEGRQGSDDFNYNIYRSNYPDLEAAFGENRAEYYHHYINSGYNEGRNAATSDYTSDTVYAGVDYAAVYNYDYYVTANPDVAAAIGDNKIAILAHFVRNGMAEGRQGNAEFNVRAYMENNPELEKEYGDDLKAYYMHYIEACK